MELESQMRAIEELQKMAYARKNSIVLSGISGSGKTYLARRYSDMLGIVDFVVVEPKVSAVKDAIDKAMFIDNDIVICIENLDTGASSVASALLKFLEEHDDNVYIVVTCRNDHMIPDTILSRSIEVDVGSPTDSDIDSYCMERYSTTFDSISNMWMYRCARSYSDADSIFNLSKDNVDYLRKLEIGKVLQDSISSATWKLFHFPDKSDVPARVMIRHIIDRNGDNIDRIRYCVEALDQIDMNRVAPYIVMNRLVMNLKYGS